MNLLNWLKLIVNICTLGYLFGQRVTDEGSSTRLILNVQTPANPPRESTRLSTASFFTTLYPPKPETGHLEFWMQKILMTVRSIREDARTFGDALNASTLLLEQAQRALPVSGHAQVTENINALLNAADIHSQHTLLIELLATADIAAKTTDCSVLAQIHQQLIQKQDTLNSGYLTYRENARQTLAEAEALLNPAQQSSAATITYR